MVVPVFIFCKTVEKAYSDRSRLPLPGNNWYFTERANKRLFNDRSLNDTLNYRTFNPSLFLALGYEDDIYGIDPRLFFGF